MYDENKHELYAMIRLIMQWCSARFHHNLKQFRSASVSEKDFARIQYSCLSLIEGTMNLFLRSSGSKIQQFIFDWLL